MRVSLRHKHQHLLLDLQPEPGGYRVLAEDGEWHVTADYLDDATLAVTVDGRRYRAHLARNARQRTVAVAGEVYAFVSESGAPSAHSVAGTAAPEITAPMPGRVLQVLVQPGEQVMAGDGLLILEAMKMENRLVAEAAATVAEVRVAAGDMVDGGKVLLVLRYHDEAA